jgi:hypothetical protein
MCRSTIDGGRRCPSHTDPLLIANRNARRRAKYAQSHGKAKAENDSLGARVVHSTPATSFEHPLFTYEIDKANGKELYRKTSDSNENAFGVFYQEYEGHLVDLHYIDRRQYSGLVDYTKLDNTSYKDFGFQSPGETRHKLMDDDELSDISSSELYDLSMGEKKALNKFTSMDYEWINGALYGKPSLTAETEEEASSYQPQYGDDEDDFLDENETYQEGRKPSFFKEIVTVMDKALEQGPKQQRILYRGMSPYHRAFKIPGGMDAYVDQNYAIGKEFKFDGYQSASYSPVVASGRAGDGLVFEIRSPSGVSVAGISNFYDEQEALLPRDARYMVVGVHKHISYAAEDSINDFTNRSKSTTVIQMVEITENGYVKDETNFAPPPPIREEQLQIKPKLG